MFKVGDKVRVKPEFRNAHFSRWVHDEAVLVVDSLAQNGYSIAVRLTEIADARYSHHNGYRASHKRASDFELICPRLPSSFSIQLDFDNVDDAIAAATQLAPSYGPVQVLPNG